MTPSPIVQDPGTATRAYTERLQSLSERRWKKALNVQALYGWNLRRLHPGFTLDLGCGVGRNLAHLHGWGIGVDHNQTSVEVARGRGLSVYTPVEFRSSAAAAPHGFDTLLAAHLVEHMRFDEATSLLNEYLPFVKTDGAIIVICPQEAGYRSDPTHVTYTDFAAIRALCRALGAEVTREYSFPFPRAFGRLFRYNEFVVVAHLNQ